MLFNIYLMKKDQEAPASIRYKKETPDGWVAEVNNWPWKKIHEDLYRKEGPCPRCGHTIKREVRYGMTFALIVFKCNCPVDHPGSGNNKGCGAFGEVELPKE